MKTSKLKRISQYFPSSSEKVALGYPQKGLMKYIIFGRLQIPLPLLRVAM